MANEETIYMAGNNQNEKTVNAQPAKQSLSPWKIVSIGGVAGVLLGTGAVYAADAYADHQEGSEDDKEAFHTLDNGLKVAEVSDDLSFKEAFDLARSEVGPGGAFHWHGNTYGTYTADEWSAMSDAEKAEYAELVRPEISAEEIGDAVTDGQNDVAHTAAQPQEVHVHNHYNQAPPQQPAQDVSVEVGNTSETSNYINASQEAEDDGVQVIQRGSIEGHDAVSLDLSNDGEADVLVVDVNDNHELDEPDVIIDTEGNMATVGQLIAEEEAQNSSADYTTAEEPQAAASYTEEDPSDSVKVIETGTVEGHQAVALDLTDNGEADVLVIDANDNYELDSPDIVVDTEGNMATVGDLMAEDDYQDGYANMDNQQDMMYDDNMDSSTPDYVDDADLMMV